MCVCLGRYACVCVFGCVCVRVCVCYVKVICLSNERVNKTDVMNHIFYSQPVAVPRTPRCDN